ncbi:hypothetical protein HanRHA438_Chr04g0154811 [Helianthus annuus]|uniref:Uncharacterized protein n=1 Tax=Helianthus annuus TaxID=4232 RepID=A0A251UV38_HELAN|nr:hypothetical protein HanXRQr2_Chr04g0143161 [Helianthus annuus]KAJ0579515.1 hypothetical protein HanHA300_Chr04g0118781 [Helianthus annuus]KAJ0586741.1 hypothetical protein HanIR_Chr04g0155191 [Helianthus annuus]KAJ0595415.1 hypothetical protein HanHA89_Chr04g0131111 [Helianthus annuus]KAJ0756091.1 hypothetical protein HanLR1_Chr04g0123121 [Helianthus annuus]
MRLQVSSNNISFKIQIHYYKPNSKTQRKEREKRRATHVSSFQKPFSQHVFFRSSFFFVVFDDFVYIFVLIAL